jgi:hypothetical protein
MGKRVLAVASAGFTLLASPVAASAQGVWVPGSEIVGHSIQVETNGVANTIHFDPGGAARIVTPTGRTVNASWTSANRTLCLYTGGGAQECWPYQAAFKGGIPVTLTSSCKVTSHWVADSAVLSQPPEPTRSSERG